MSSDETRSQEVATETEIGTPEDANASTTAASPPDNTPPTETAVAETPASAESAPVETASPETAPATEAETKPETASESGAPETPAESPATDAAAEPTAASGSAPEESKRRPRLNPTVDDTAVKPVSSLEATNTPSSPPPAAADAAPAADNAGEAPAESADVSAEEKPAPQPQRAPAAPPVELPPAQQSLDSEMEAEIEAALASGDLDAAKVVPAKAVDQETGEAAEAPAEPVTEESIEEGMHLTGKIQSIHGDDVFLDLGIRSPGVVQSRQFSSGKKPQIGQAIEVVVAKVDRDEGLIQLNLPHGMRKVTGDWESLAAGQTVDCVVTKTNKGGLEVTVGSLRGFMPAGQVDLMFVSELESFVGQQLRAQIVEANPRKRNLVVSRRAHLLEERKEAEAELWKTIKVGQNLPGRVKTLKDYGAFIDIGGADGFLHIGEISWSRINKPSDVLQVGQEVEVQVISLDPEKKKIGLGMRQLVTNPWSAVTTNYPVESTVSGKVTRIADFGAFVELEPGVEGLVHISEIDYARVNRVADALKVGQEIQAKVTAVDPDKRRIGLSIKALKAKPEGQGGKRPSEQDLAPGGGEPYQRKRKGPLKGGMGNSSGGLFGNPADYE